MDERDFPALKKQLAASSDKAALLSKAQEERGALWDDALNGCTRFKDAALTFDLDDTGNKAKKVAELRKAAKIILKKGKEKMTMRTLVRFEYDIENVKLFDIVDGGAVHGAFNGNLTIYFDMSEDGKLLDESKQALRLEARRICRALKNRGMNATVSILNADTKAVYGRVFAEHPEIFTLLLWNHGRGNDLSKEQHALTPSGVYKALERILTDIRSNAA